MNRLKFKISLLFFSIMILLSLTAQSQTYTGCVIYEASGDPRLSDGIYTTSLGSTSSCNGYTVQNYSSTPTTGALSSFCYTPTLSNASPALYRNCVTGGRCGIITTITIVNCPIDDYIVYFALTLSVAAISMLRKLY